MRREMGIDKSALERLRQVVGGDEADVVEIVATFIDEGALLLDVLKSSAAANELAPVRRAAHSIKSNARDLGAAALAETCSRIEAAAAKGEFPSAEEVAAVSSEMSDALSELKMIYNLGGGT